MQNETRQERSKNVCQLKIRATHKIENFMF